MSPMERMILLGLPPDEAAAVEKYFAARADWAGLERFIADKSNFRSEASAR